MHQNRQSFIDSINSFICSSKTYLHGVLDEIGWSKESIYSALHKNLQSHENESTEILGKALNERSETTADNESLNKLTVGSQPLLTELVATLNQSHSSMKPGENKSRAEVLLEMLKMERDAKRRRINYKNRVHTKNKSHVEIMREVLAEQMATHFGGAEAGNDAKENHPDNDKQEIIEVQLPYGNPYTAWKKILEEESLYTERVKEKRGKDSFQSHDRHKYPKKKDNSSRNKDNHSEKDSKHIYDRSYKARYSDHSDTSRDEYVVRYQRGHNRSEFYGDKYYKKQKSLKHMTGEDMSPQRDSKEKRAKDSICPPKTLENISDEQCMEKKHKKNRSLSSSPKRKSSKKHKRDRSRSTTPKRNKVKKHKRNRSRSSSPKIHKSKKHKLKTNR